MLVCVHVYEYIYIYIKRNSKKNCSDRTLFLSSRTKEKNELKTLIVGLSQILPTFGTD